MVKRKFGNSSSSGMGRFPKRSRFVAGRRRPWTRSSKRNFRRNKNRRWKARRTGRLVSVSRGLPLPTVLNCKMRYRASIADLSALVGTSGVDNYNTMKVRLNDLKKPFDNSPAGSNAQGYEVLSKYYANYRVLSTIVKATFTPTSSSTSDVLRVGMSYNGNNGTLSDVPGSQTQQLMAAPRTKSVILYALGAGNPQHTTMSSKFRISRCAWEEGIDPKDPELQGIGDTSPTTRFDLFIWYSTTRGSSDTSIPAPVIEIEVDYIVQWTDLDRDYAYDATVNPFPLDTT